MLVDFHSHTTISDGSLSVEDMVAAAERHGYTHYAITDHARPTGRDYREVAQAVRQAVDRLRGETPVRLFAGVELTDWAPQELAGAAAEVRRHGAQVVVVHGECVSMPVKPGTNGAAVSCRDIDVLGHPGLVTLEEAREAARNGVALELSARAGHCWGNGHVYRTARKAGAPLIVDSDAHEEAGLLSESKVMAIIRGAGAMPRPTERLREEMGRRIVGRILGREAVATR